MPQLTLYHTPHCSYCLKVLTFLRQNNIAVTLKDRSDPVVLDELVKIGGKTQVPCLVIDGKALFESDDIIQWIKENCKE